MVTIIDALNSCLAFLAKAKELEDNEPSVLEVGTALGWNYPKTRNVAKALEEAGLIKLELYRGIPRKYIVRVTHKGECILKCIDDNPGLSE